MTDKQFVLEYVSTLHDARCDCPFEDDFDSTVLRHKSNNKWFGIVLSVSGSKIGREDPKRIDILNLKSNPEESLILYELYPEIKPGYHMNKTHWISLPLDGCLSENTVCTLIDKSYELTKKKTRRA